VNGTGPTLCVQNSYPKTYPITSIVVTAASGGVAATRAPKRQSLCIAWFSSWLQSAPGPECVSTLGWDGDIGRGSRTSGEKGVKETLNSSSPPVGSLDRPPGSEW